MAKKVSPQDSSSLELLFEAVNHNQSVELQHVGPTGKVRSGKTRLLFMDADSLYLATPVQDGKPVAFGVDCCVDVYTRVHRQTYAFQSKVLRTDCVIKLNSGKTLTGIQLSKPSELKETQRRNNYRVSLASMVPIDAMMQAVCDQDTNSESGPVGGKIKSQLVNLSSGGCGVVLSQKEAQKFRLGNLILLSFDLPVESESFTFQTRICQIIPVQERETVRLGLQFVEWPNRTEFRKALRPLEKFIADLQRAEARRLNPRRD